MTSDRKRYWIGDPDHRDPIWDAMRASWLPEDIRARVEVRERTDRERAWDSAVSACAEYVRRANGFDEDLSLRLLRAVALRRRGE